MLALLLDFTGYVLRWDEGIRWALMVGTNLLKTIPLIGEEVYRFMIGGTSPAAPTLLRFYAWHIFGLMAHHGGAGRLAHLPGAARRRDCGAAARAAPDPRRISRDELVRPGGAGDAVRHGAAGRSRPCFCPRRWSRRSSRRRPRIAPDVRAPWFFLWVQQMLRYGEAFWMGVGLPLILLGVLAALPYLFPHLPEGQRGRWLPKAGRWAQLIGGAVVLAWIVLTVLELLN